MDKATAGDARAACVLADRYRVGDGVLCDWEKAFHWYSVAAQLGDPDAQNNLGSMYLNGVGCEADQDEAIRWYAKSAEQGCTIAQYNLAKRYLHGDGTPQNYQQARGWFEKAAVRGEVNASCELGTMYWLGQGVERNILAAADFHLIAADAGDKVAAQNIGEYQSEVEALARSGNQMASLFMSHICNRGYGVEPSQAKTWAWILWAQKYCNPCNDSEITDEIAGAHKFYRQTIMPESRKEGESMVRTMRAVGYGIVERKSSKTCTIDRGQKHPSPSAVSGNGNTAS